MEEGRANGPNGELPRSVVEGPTNPMVTPLLTDLYQFTMAYAYWKAGKHNERAVSVILYLSLSPLLTVWFPRKWRNVLIFRLSRQPKSNFCLFF